MNSADLDLKAKGMEFLAELAQRVSRDEIRLFSYEVSCPAVPVESDGPWLEYEPSPITTLTIRYETRRQPRHATAVRP